MRTFLSGGAAAARRTPVRVRAGAHSAAARARALVAAMVLLALAGPPLALGGTWFDEQTIDHDGLTRYYRYYVPDVLEPGQPVLFVLHGGGGDYVSVTANGAPAEWTEIADEEGFLIVCPNGIDADTGSASGTDQNWNDCRGDAPATDTGADDVGFISALIDWAAVNYQVDLQRVYATGASNGGMMSYRLAFELDDRIAAIAAFIANLPAVDECSPPTRPTPVLVANGDAETNYMPWGGGCVTNAAGCPRGTVTSALATRDFWLSHNGLAPPPFETDHYPDIDPDDGARVRSERYVGGAQGSAVEFWQVLGGGHNMPSIDHPRSPLTLILLGLGNQSHDVESARIAWVFLRRHRLDGTLAGGPAAGAARDLRVDALPGDGVRLSWSSDCAGQGRYAVYRGDLSLGYGSLTPAAGLCAVEALSVDLAPVGVGAEFYLVVPHAGALEGSYGLDGGGAQRPPAVGACLPQASPDACADIP